MFRRLENLFFPTSAVRVLLTAREKSLTENANANDHYSSLKKTFKTSATKL